MAPAIRTAVAFLPILVACGGPPPFAVVQAAEGWDRDRLTRELGAPLGEDVNEKRRGDVWFGPIEEILDRVAVGDTVITWIYAVEEGRAHVFFIGRADTVRFVRLAPSGVVYEPGAGVEPSPNPGASPGDRDEPTPCTDAWFRLVEARTRVIDAAGHGPDIGSSEWMSAVEFKLGIRGDPGLPESGSPAWCEEIDSRIR